jgi:hypothetical protein
MPLADIRDAGSHFSRSSRQLGDVGRVSHRSTRGLTAASEPGYHNRLSLTTEPHPYRAATGWSAFFFERERDEDVFG